MRANGEAIREIRKGRRLTLMDIREETGLHVGYLSELERGLKDARPETLDRIAGALRCKVTAISRVAP